MTEPSPATGSGAMSDAELDRVVVAAGGRRPKRPSALGAEQVLYIARRVDVRPPTLPGELRGTWESVHELADKLRQRASVAWNTVLSPATTLLVADALDQYEPAPPSEPLPPRPHSKFHVDMFSQGSTVYRLFKGEIHEISAWAESSIVAGVAFEKLVEQYPNERFLQKRRSWVERE